jgi:hypothetical protein
MFITDQQELLPLACERLHQSSARTAELAQNLSNYPTALTNGIGVMQHSVIRELTEAERRLEAALRIVRKARAQAMAVPVQRLEAAE